ncbi:MAG TPA: hypothetical protein P5160_05560 [Candidatus Omnitrophota bacterium]|nr:hypothetical protein [Candidatus Omnitrophota bacterium]
MSRSRSFKTLLSFCIILCLSTDAFAFISPHTIQVIASAMGMGLIYILVVFCAGTISFLKLIKNKASQQRLRFWAAIFTLFLAAFISLKYYDIRFKTYLSYKCCHEASCDVDYCGELIASPGVSLPYQEFKAQRYVDLNTIDPQTYGSFQVLGIDDFYPIRLLNDDSPSAKKFYMNPQEMEKALRKFDKNKKILIYFTYYDYSSLLAYTAFSLGYDAYYTALAGLRSDALLKYDMPKEELLRILPNIHAGP